MSGDWCIEAIGTSKGSLMCGNAVWSSVALIAHSAESKNFIMAQCLFLAHEMLLSDISYCSGFWISIEGSKKDMRWGNVKYKNVSLNQLLNDVNFFYLNREKWYTVHILNLYKILIVTFEGSFK